MECLRSYRGALSCLALAVLLGVQQMSLSTARELSQELTTEPSVHLDNKQISRIPHILHYIFLSGFDAYLTETQRSQATLRTWYRDTCMEVHKHWTVMFWTEEMAEKFLTEHYSCFLPVWTAYDMEIKRTDALRVFILMHYGGLYLDLDIECYSPAEATFLDHDVVLQGAGFEGIGNGMMASRPGHPLFMQLVELLMERSKGSETEEWQNGPTYMTGPAVLTFTLQKYFKLSDPVSGWLGRTYHVDSSTVRVYSMGEFFMPCWGTDYVCIRRFEKGRANGALNMTLIVGRHWFPGSWNKPWLLKPRKQGKGLEVAH